MNPGLVKASLGGLHWDELESCVKQLQHLFRDHSKSFNVYCASSLERFQKLSDEQKVSAQNVMKELVASLKGAVAEGVDLSRNVDFLKYSCTRLAIRPSRRFLETVTEEDLIEIYNPEGVQVYRNFRFFEISGYSLLDLLTNDWSTLYERSTSIEAHMQKAVMRVFQDQEDFFQAEVPTHLMRERFSTHRQINTLEFRYVGATYSDQDQINGLICSSRSALFQNPEEAENIKFF